MLFSILVITLAKLLEGDAPFFICGLVTRPWAGLPASTLKFHSMLRFGEFPLERLLENVILLYYAKLLTL